MRRRFLLLCLVVSLVGCTRYQSRVSPPQARMPSPYAPRPESPTGMASRSPLTMPASSTASTKPTTSAEPTEVSLVPPLPREPMPKNYVVQPPSAPGDRDGVMAASALPPVSAPPGLPRSVALTGQPGKLDKDVRPEPSPSELPSPFAKSRDVVPAAGVGGASKHLDKVQSLAATGLERWKSMSTYEARLTRQEILGSKEMPREEMLYRVRREPFALAMKITGENGKGREVLYNPSQHGDKMHIIVGAGDSFFLKAGSRAPSMSPDNRAVMEKSRHSIREAGFGNSLGRFQAILDKVQAGRARPDSLVFAGAEERKDMPGFTLERVDQTVAPGEETLMPRGGKRHWYFDTRTDSISYGMPVLVVTIDGGREVEYYRFDQFRIPAGLTDADFDPETMGKKK